jgi:ketosteroid isomerase-like protein
MDSAERFAASFREFWRAPSPEGMRALLSEDVVLVQPLSAPLHGIESVVAEFRRIFAWLPDLHGEVDAFRGAGDTLFIAFRLRASLGGRTLEWPVVDHFTLRGDRACARVSYFDSGPLLLRVLATPRSWPRWWRSGAARPWRFAAARGRQP